MAEKRSWNQRQQQGGGSDRRYPNNGQYHSSHVHQDKQPRKSIGQASPASRKDIFETYNEGRRQHEKNSNPPRIDANREDVQVTPLDRVALFRQLSDELEHDPSFAKEFSKAAGEETATAAKNLAKFLNAQPSILSRIAAQGPQAPHMPTKKQQYYSLQAWFERFPDHLPALPPILDSSIEARVFTAASSIDTHHSHHTQSYEKLEWLGDAYLEVITRRICYNAFTDTSEALPALVTQDFVRNENLASFALAYAFDERLKLGPRHMANLGGSARKSMVKVLGDVFEAYVAGIIESDPDNGYQTAYNWLASLIKPTIMKYQNTVPKNPKAKEDLARKVLGKGIKIEWEEYQPQEAVKGGVLYFYSAFLTGWGYKKQLLGSGKGSSKSQAQVLAAMEALTNPTTAIICAIKKEYDALVKIEREKEGGPDPAVIEQLDKKYKEIPVV